MKGDADGEFSTWPSVGTLQTAVCVHTHKSTSAPDTLMSHRAAPVVCPRQHLRHRNELHLPGGSRCQKPCGFRHTHTYSLQNMGGAPIPGNPAPSPRELHERTFLFWEFPHVPKWDGQRLGASLILCQARWVRDPALLQR